MGDDARLRALVRLVGWAVVTFALLRWLPTVVTGTERGTSSPTATIVLAVAVYCAALTLVARPRFLTTRRYHEGVVVALLGLFLLWVLIQPLFRLADQEAIRSASLVAMIAAAVLVGRFLTATRSTHAFLAGLAPYFAGAYVVGFLLAIVNPHAVWWGYGILGSNATRSFFYWFVTPEPVFAIVALAAAIQSTTSRLHHHVYAAALLTVTVMVVMTRTRVYLGAIMAVAVLYAVRRWPARTAAAGVGALVLVLSAPGVSDDVARFTRLSAFTSGVDPVSGRDDPTNGRAELTRHLLELADEDGSGATAVRARTADLDASSESGLLFMFASYGLPTVALVLFLAVGWLRGAAGWLVSRDRRNRLLASAVLVMAPMGAVEWLGTATSFTDWLALVLISSAVFVPARRVTASFHDDRVRAGPSRRRAPHRPVPR